MPIANLDYHSMVEEANKQADYTADDIRIMDEDKRVRDRTRGKSRYMRNAVVRIFSLSPEGRANYTPRNGFEEAALQLFNMTQKDTSAAVAAFKEVKDTLGEQIKDDKADVKAGPSIILNDIPLATRKLSN